MKLNILLICALLTILGQTLVPKSMNFHKIEMDTKVGHKGESGLTK